jgi:uncharacterized membrane protein
MRSARTWTPLLMGCLAVGLLVQCGGGHSHSHQHEGSGATCPTGSTLTYESFGQTFMSTYCTRCHSQTKTGPSRIGAPADHNFDTIDEIRVFKNHIDEHAAAGPNGTNRAMPLGQPKPERRRTTEARRVAGLRGPVDAGATFAIARHWRHARRGGETVNAGDLKSWRG